MGQKNNRSLGQGFKIHAPTVIEEQVPRRRCQLLPERNVADKTFLNLGFQPKGDIFSSCSEECLGHLSRESPILLKLIELFHKAQGSAGTNQWPLAEAQLLIFTGSRSRLSTHSVLAPNGLIKVLPP